MGLQNSEIILVKNIKLDKNYVNVLSYSEEQMLNLCRKNAIATALDYSFIRQNKNSIFTNFSYEQCLQANYIAFQNKDYSNKWFFAFIDDVIYVGDNNTEIVFTIDSWSTWFDYWQKQPCYIIREHVNNDSIGLHTVPEPVDTGEYVVNNIEDVHEMNDLVVILQVSQFINGEVPLATNFGGVWQAGGAYVFENINDMVSVLQAFGEGRNESIIQAYLVPKYFVNMPANEMQYPGQNAPYNLSKEIAMPTNLDGYVPKNNKLFTFPYCFLNVSNNNGSSNTYPFEFFKSGAKFNIKGVPVCGGSLKLVPYEFRTGGENYNEEEGLIAGKYPTLSWSEDSYTNWLTQNAVNLGLGLTSNLLSIATGIATLNPVAGVGGLVTGSMGIASQMGQIYQHSLNPNTAKGNTNGGDINVSSGCNNFYFYTQTIRREYAEIIDNFFTRFGYKINKIETPNIIGRKSWNYLEIGQNENIGYGSVPSSFMEQINNACRSGVTIWHSHENLGNFNLDNSIV